jgi:hypothetical protein
MTTRLSARARVAFVAVLAAALVCVPAAAFAKFTSSKSASTTVSSDTLAAPTGLAVKCSAPNQRATITWTATADTYATGYVVYAASGSTESSQNVSGRTTVSYTSTIVVPAGSIITMVSVYRGWTSARSASVTAPSNCR